MPVGESLDTILGMGYSGAINIGNVWLPIRASSVTEDDNLIHSQGAYSSLIPYAVGTVPSRNRRILNVNVSMDLSYAAFLILNDAFLVWRLNSLPGSFYQFSLFLANSEGYYSPEAYIQACNVAAPENGFCSCSFSLIAFRWQDNFAGASTPRSQSPFTPYQNANLQPIPHWLTQVSHPGHAGTALSWSLHLQNQYQFIFLCEGTPGPPTPRIANIGPLESEFTYTTLAYRNNRPSEIARGAQLKVGGGGVGGVTIPAAYLNFPELYRDPNRSPQGFGDLNSPIRWQATWHSLGTCPFVT